MKRRRMSAQRILPFLMSACLVIAPGTYVENPDAFTYVVEEGRATITGYLGSEPKVRIPSELGGAPVVMIGDFVFAGSDLQMVEIPRTVTAIGEGAFAGCESLFSVDVPATVLRIGEGAFAGCTLLTAWFIEPCDAVDFMVKNSVSYIIRTP